MDDTLLNDDALEGPGFIGDVQELALALGNLIRDHRGEDVVILDLRELNSWTDFFIVATVSSSVHVQGILRYIKEFTREYGVEILHNRRKVTEDSWHFVDLGGLVIHLMTEKSRSFYELERLWSSAPQIRL